MLADRAVVEHAAELNQQRGAELQILHLPSEAELQNAAELAAEICGTPISLVSVLDEQWQTVLASVGIRIKQVRRDITVCTHTLAKNDLLVVDDMMRDMRFAGHPMVTGDPEVRFYAGLPLEAPDGTSIGTLCVIDVKPRQLSGTQERALRVIAKQIKTTMQLRAEHRKLEEALAERDRATTRLHANEQTFQAFMNNSPLMAYMKDAQGRFVFYNTLVAERFRITMSEWLGKTDADVLGAVAAQQYREHDLEVLQSGRLLITEETTCIEGECVTWRSYKFPCEDEEGQRMLAGLSVDVTEDLRRQAELADAKKELERLGSVDPLTGLPRRQVLDEELDLHFEEAQRRRRTLSLVILDVDNLRRRNDRMGRDAGDAALKTIGDIVRECVTEADVAVRFGGAEFALLLPETTAEEAKALSERVQREMRKVDWGIVSVTLSVGVATNEHAKRSGRQLFCFADDAMYSAKIAGKNRVVVYSPR